MVTTTFEAALTDTRNAVNARKNGKSWRRLSDEIGISHGILHAIGNGEWRHVSWDTVREVRQHLGLQDFGPVVPAFACPVCAGVHQAASCDGKPVVDVVCLTDGEMIVHASRPKTTRSRRAAHRPYITDERKWQAYLKWSAAYDEEMSYA